MKRYYLSEDDDDSDGGGLTLKDLRRFLANAEAMSFPDATRLRARVKFGNSRGAKIKEISIDNKDRIAEDIP